MTYAKGDLMLRLFAILFILWGSPAYAGATVVLTFDTYVSTYTNALFDMDAKGIPGTFFADADRVGTAGQPSRDNLIIMAMKGWEIGARVYGTINGGEANMVAVLAAADGRSIAFSRLKAAKDLMYAQGFDIKSISAAQRAWSSPLRGMAGQLFENVRVTDQGVWGSYPIADRLYVRQGATDSFSASDTVASLCAQLDAVIAANGIWIPVVHNIDTTGDPIYTISPTVFQGFTSCLQSKIALGVVRAVTLSKAMTP